jgi:putative DNA primase/helicase
MTGASIPKLLRDRPQWLLWRFEQHPGEKKPRKVPYYANGRRRTGEQGAAADRTTLVSFEAAAQASGDYSGLGFAFLPGDGLIGIDLDGMIDAETGEICERGGGIIEACASYTELSPSGRGVHIICSGETETFKSNAAGIEVFCGRQFFTFTGRHYAGAPADVRPIPPEVLRRLRATVEQARQGHKSAAPAPLPQSGAAKVESALAYVSPDCGYDDWIAIGMAVHAELGAAGFAVWDAWSARSEKYPGERELRGHWKSFRPGAITGATLYGRATAAGWRAPRAPEDKAPAAPERAPGAAPAQPEPEWPEPMMPGAMKVPGIPCALLPGWVGEMAAAVADSTQTPEAMSTMLALSVLGTVLQRRFEVAPYGEDDEYTEPVNLWTLTAMPSGARKTAVINALAAPLMRWEKLERDRMRSEIARVFAVRAVALRRIEKLTRDAANAETDDARRRLRDEIQREKEYLPEEIHAQKLFGGDTTAEATQTQLVRQGERFAILTDEGGIFLVMAGLYSGGQASLDVFLQAHAGSPVRVDRADREAYLERPALSFGLALQPGIMADVASGRRFRDSGLLARFLYAMPESNVGRRDVRRRVAIPEVVRSAYEAGLFALLEKRPLVPGKPRLLPFTDPARETWLDFAEEIERAQGEGGKLESISDWTSKLPGAAARIAGLIEIAESGLAAESVSETAVARAVRLARLLIPHAQEAFGLLGADVADADAIAILRWARAEGLASFKRSTCQKAMEGRFRNVARLTAAAQRLIERDVLREIKVPNKGAPPSVWYQINPKCLST